VRELPVPAPPPSPIRWTTPMATPSPPPPNEREGALHSAFWGARRKFGDTYEKGGDYRPAPRPPSN
jgi:hypothetical protein